ncbi:MAG TPA: trehalose-phosphatase, partial [Magnetospirillum sp.]|nr:trehalose-phosphatase [Magnetospirillum sp.]
LLQRLADTYGGAVALVSGRSLDNLRQLVAPFDPPAAGLHGIEWRDAAGAAHQLAVPEGLDDIRARLAHPAGNRAGLLVEDKGLAVALHYRLAPELGPLALSLAQAALVGHPGFTLVEGKMVVEIKPKGADKGSALETLMAHPPFAGRRPVFVGDDVTDEDGFAAANRLGGLSVLIGEARKTGATHRLPTIDACLSWLAVAAGTRWLPHMGEGAD